MARADPARRFPVPRRSETGPRDRRPSTHRSLSVDPCHSEPRARPRPRSVSLGTFHLIRWRLRTSPCEPGQAADTGWPPDARPTPARCHPPGRHEDGAQGIQDRHCVHRRHRAHVRRLKSCLACPVACQGRRAQCVVHRPGRHRIRPDGLLRKPDRNPQHRPARRGRPAVQQHAHHGALLADTLVHPDRAEPPFQRDVVHHRRIHRLSRRERLHSVRERISLRDAAAARLQHLCHRQMAPHRGGSGVRGRTL